MKNPLLVAGLFGAVLVLAGAWWLLRDDHVVGSASVDMPRVARDAAPTSLSHAPLLADERQVSSLATPVPAAPAVDAPTVPESYRLALGGVTGRILDASGAPLPDVPVALVGGGPTTFLIPRDALLSPDLAVPDLVLGETRTDGEGRFTLRAIETRVLGAVLVDPGGPRAYFSVLEQTPVSGGMRDLGDIVLPASVTLTGIVIDEREEPLAGVRVRAVDIPSFVLDSGVADFHAGCVLHLAIPELDQPFTFEPPPEVARYEAMLPIPTARTDGEGRFTLFGVPAGVQNLVLDDGVHEPTVRGGIITGPAGGTRDIGLVVLPDGETVVVRVLDEQGRPVRGATVMTGNRMTLGPVAILKGPYATADDGRVAVSGLRSTHATAVARVDERQEWAASFDGATAGSGEEIVVRLPGARRLTVEVVDGTGARLPGAQLLGRALPDDDAEEFPDFLLKPRRLDERLTVTDEGLYVLAPMQPALWEIAARVDGYSVEREMVSLSTADATLRIALEAVRAHPVQVLRASDDEPVEHALLLVTVEGRTDSQVTTARTDRDGRAALQGLADGSYGLEILHPALAVTRVDFTVPGDELVVRLAVGGRIAGTVVDQDAAPAEPLLVLLEPRQEERTAGGQMPRMTLTDLEGRFSFADVEPGEVNVSARERFRFTSLTNWWEPFAMTPLAEESVQVVAGEESSTVLYVGSTLDGIETARVSGRVLVNGRPVAGWKVRTWGQVRRSATTDDQGHFDMGRIAAGEVSLLVSSGSESMPGASVDVIEFDLTPNVDEYREIFLRTGVVEGRVLFGSSNRPAQGARVTVRSEDRSGGWWGGRRSMTVTDADGRYVLEPVVEGSYVAEVEMDGYGTTSSAAFAVTALGTARVPDLRVNAAVKVAGRITLAGSTEPPQWIWMNAVNEHGVRATSRPDRVTMEYEFDDITPGTWTIEVATGDGVDYDPVTLVVTGEMPNQPLVFQPPPPEPEDDDQTEALEALGYLGDG